jgi:anti-sigma factor RsiW
VTVDDRPSAEAGCDPVRVTAYVDGALSPDDRLPFEAHIAGCPRCQAQVDAERMLASAVRSLPPPPLPHGLAARVRRRSRKPVTLRRRVWIPSLAAMLLLVLLGRGSSRFVAWEVALDHAHCFGKQRVPAQVLTADPMRLSAWFEAQGTELPLIPASAGGLDLVGGRYCRLLDRAVAHVYYGGGEHELSLFVIPGSVRFDRSFMWRGSGMTVNLIHVAGSNVALVSTDLPSIAAFRRSLERTIAEGGTRVTVPPALW